MSRHKNCKRQKTLLIISFAVLAICSVLTGCDTVTIQDVEVCGDLGQFGAHCAMTLTDGQRDIPKKAWDKERLGMLCLTSQSFNDTETVIDQFCAAYPGTCSYETQVQLHESLVRVQSVIKKQKKVNHGQFR